MAGKGASGRAPSRAVRVVNASCVMATPGCGSSTSSFTGAAVGKTVATWKPRVISSFGL